MVDRQITQQTIYSLLAKLDDPDADLRYMSLNDLYGILTNPNSSFLSHDRSTSTKLAEGLLKALDDQHGDVQNQALKWFVLSAIPLCPCLISDLKPVSVLSPSACHSNPLRLS